VDDNDSEAMIQNLFRQCMKPPPHVKANAFLLLAWAFRFQGVGQSLFVLGGSIGCNRPGRFLDMGLDTALDQDLACADPTCKIDVHPDNFWIWILQTLLNPIRASGTVAASTG
jgi:hypothetical protein